MSVIDRYSEKLVPQYTNYPRGRFVSIILVRKIESEAIFRTEGSGEPLNREYVFAGRSGQRGEPIPRIVISKRKQVAVERRTGRELLRRLELLFTNKSGRECALNTNNPCERCVDCMVYGYAAGGGGAQKSRVITDDAFSLHSADIITGKRQFNGLFDNSTMRDADDTPSTSIGTDEYVRPESVFLDIETLKDVTPDELRYILGNILRSTRYGAISSRIGKTQNIIAGVIFSDCELFSNLELTQLAFDQLAQGGELAFPLDERAVVQAVRSATEQLGAQVVGPLTPLSADEIADLQRELAVLFGDEQQLGDLLRRLSASYKPKG